MKPFTPTHVIGLTRREVILVQLCVADDPAGSAYTQREWETGTTAAYERDHAGNWTFQGQSFHGTVNTVAKSVEYLGFTITPSYRSGQSGRMCRTQQGWQTTHPAKLPHVQHGRREQGWHKTLTRAKEEIDDFAKCGRQGLLTPERRDDWCAYFPHLPRPMARGELTPEQQAEKDTAQKLWEADKAGAARVLAVDLIGRVQDRCEDAATEHIDWTDEQTLEVLEAAVALVRKRLRLEEAKRMSATPVIS
jgi:hypothetical protein